MSSIQSHHTNYNNNNPNSDTTTMERRVELKNLDHLFQLLHQTQIGLIQKPSKSLAIDYASKIDSTVYFNSSSTSEDSKLFEFVMLPVLSALKRLNTTAVAPTPAATDNLNNPPQIDWSDINEHLLSGCVLSLLKKYPHPLDSKLFTDILNVCSIVLSRWNPTETATATATTNKQRTTMSDELLNACVLIVAHLFGGGEHSLVSESVEAQFFVVSSLTTLGLVVAKLLDILVDSGSIQLRLDSLAALKSILTRPGRADEIDGRVGVMFASFLPGISIRLVQKFLLHENLKLLNHKLICSSLDVLGITLASVFNDQLLDEMHFRAAFKRCCTSREENGSDNVERSATTSEMQQKKKKEIEALMVDRVKNAEWLGESSKKVFYLIESLTNALVTHEHSQVKLALVRLCGRVSHACYFSLNMYLHQLLKVLVTCAVAAADYNVDQQNDTDNQVVIEANYVIEQLEKKEINPNLKFIQPNRFSLVASSINELLLKLPRLVSETDSSGQLYADSRVGHLRTVFGYLKLISGGCGGERGDNIPRLSEFFLNNEHNLNHLMDALVNCVKFDYTSLNNFYEIQTTPTTATERESVETMHLSNYNGLETYLHDRCGFAELRSICALLGSSDAARLVVDHLLNSDLAHLHQRRYKLEALFLIDLVLVGLEKRPDPNAGEKLAIVNMILSSHLNDLKQRDHRDLTETIEDNTNNNMATLTSSRNRTILQICLTLEVISSTSRFFRLGLNASPHMPVLFLIDNLYFILENFLSPNLLIKCVATRCLHELARHMNYASPQRLLSANYDLLMNELVLKSNNLNRRRHDLRRGGGGHRESGRHSSHVRALCALIRVASADLCPYLERLVDDYLFAAQINSADQQLIEGICQIVAYMTEAMRVWYPVKFDLLANNNIVGDDEEEQQDAASYDLSRLDLEKFTAAKKRHDERTSFSEALREHDEHLASVKREKLMWQGKMECDEKSKHQNKTDFDVNDNEEDNDDDDNQEKKKKTSAPLHVRLQTRCLELCTHLVSHPSREVRLRVVNLVRELSKNLAEHTDAFLPLVHKLWSPICQRFTLDDHIVKARIVCALFDLCVLSGDFLASRFLKEFLPRLCQFMSEQQTLWQRQRQQSNPTTYVYSQAFKLQCAVLANIDKICVVVEIKQSELEAVIDAIVLECLDKRQPKRLQALACEAMRNCALIDPDIVWLCLFYVVPFRSLAAQWTQHAERAEQAFSAAGMRIINPKRNIELSDETLSTLLDLFNSI